MEQQKELYEKFNVSQKHIPREFWHDNERYVRLLSNLLTSLGLEKEVLVEIADNYEQKE